MNAMICPRCWGHGQEPDQAGVVKMACTHCNGDGHCEDIRLSEHFSLSEFLYSETAVRLGLANDPPASIVGRLQRLANEFLEPVRREVGALHVNSGYRSSKLNEAVHSHPTSAHPAGWAADIVSTVGLTRKQVVDRIVAIKLNFDQVIFEGTWVHVGLFKPDGSQRKEVLATYDGGKTYPKYDPNDKRIHT